MTQPQLQDLLEAGVHFGHQTRRWNPKMRRFIFAERSGIYLIDLQKTLNQLRAAQDLLREVVIKGENVLFVCTKKQLNQVVRGEAERAGAHWVTERWLGGTLTNFQTIKQQIRRLKELEQGQDEGAFIIDAKKERIAIAEANKLGIPVVAIVDTNADPDLITVPIPGNDDAIRSVTLITSALVEIMAEARKQVPTREASPDAEAYSSYAPESTEADEEDQRRRRPRRRRRPKPEAIAARLKPDAPAEPRAPRKPAPKVLEDEAPAAEPAQADDGAEG